MNKKILLILLLSVVSYKSYSSNSNWRINLSGENMLGEKTIIITPDKPLPSGNIETSVCVSFGTVSANAPLFGADAQGNKIKIAKEELKLRSKETKLLVSAVDISGKEITFPRQSEKFISNRDGGYEIWLCAVYFPANAFKLENLKKSEATKYKSVKVHTTIPIKVNSIEWTHN